LSLTRFWTGAGIWGPGVMAHLTVVGTPSASSSSVSIVLRLRTIGFFGAGASNTFWDDWSGAGGGRISFFRVGFFRILGLEEAVGTRVGTAGALGARFLGAGLGTGVSVGVVAEAIAEAVGTTSLGLRVLFLGSVGVAVVAEAFAEALAEAGGRGVFLGALRAFCTSLVISEASTE